MLTIGDYTILQWMVIFMSYCILGWVFESVYCSLKEMKLINRGFCHGPWLPLYGTGASLLILVAWPFHENLFLVYLVGFFGGTALELLTGVVLYKIFNMRWWDYTQNPFNFKGYICLYASIAWGDLPQKSVEDLWSGTKKASETSSTGYFCAHFYDRFSCKSKCGIAFTEQVLQRRSTVKHSLNQLKLTVVAFNEPRIGIIFHCILHRFFVFCESVYKTLYLRELGTAVLFNESVYFGRICSHYS